MPNVKQIQIGNDTYDIHDVTARASLAGKQNTISDLSTIRTNASNAKTKSDTAISRLNNFDVGVTKYYANQTTLPAVSTARLLGAQRAVLCDQSMVLGSVSWSWDDDYKSLTDGTWLGTMGWHGYVSAIVTYITHSSNSTTMYMRNLSTSDLTLDYNNTWTREAFILLG